MVLNHFCDIAKRKAVTILQSLLLQIFQKGGPNQKTLLEKHCEESDSPSCKELSKILLEAVRFNENTYMVLDALDEHDDRKILIPILQRMTKAGVKILVTSRNTPDIRDAFQSEDSLEIQAPRSDLEIYVSNRLTEGDLYDSQKLDLGMVSAIVDQANGM